MIQSSLSRRRSHSKSLELTKSRTGGVEEAQLVLGAISEAVNSFANVAYFIMGILSNWFSGVDPLYHKIKTISGIFDSCKSFLSELWNIYGGNLPEPEISFDKKLENKKKKEKIEKEEKENDDKFKKIEKEEETSVEKNHEKCSEMKKEIVKIRDMCLDEFWPDKNAHVINEKASIRLGYDSMSADNFCKYVLSVSCPKTHEKISKKFGGITKEDFVDVCMKYRETGDCSGYIPNNKGVWYFMKKTWKYMLFLKDGYSCVTGVLKKGGKDETNEDEEVKEVKALYEAAFGTKKIAFAFLKEIGSLILHILSFAVWGTLKAIYHIVKLGIMIYKFRENFIENLAYNAGRLVGLSIKIIKSFLVGRRRKR
jgi:hypothetical protein